MTTTELVKEIEARDEKEKSNRENAIELVTQLLVSEMREQNS